jgi:hypothetical protein
LTLQAKSGSIDTDMESLVVSKENPVKQGEKTNERRTLNLWPDAGRALGIGKNATYEAAERGDIAGAIRMGGRWLVLRDPFERMLRGETTGAKA